jgi:hypothetical protein
MLVIGLDEAGYGPLLGPLVVGGTAFRLATRVRPACAVDLHAALDGLACRAGGAPPALRRRRGAGREVPAALPVVLDDSKQVKERHGLPGLARGLAFAMQGAGRAVPAHLGDLLAACGDRPPAQALAEPWWGEPELARVPEAGLPRDLRARCLLKGVEPLGAWVAPAFPAELNEAFAATGNKSRTLFLCTLTLLLRMLQELPGDEVLVRLDRQGGRLDYGAWLAGVFPFHQLEELDAPPGEAHYRLREGPRTVEVAFVTGGDARHLEVGVASMAAKLVRELCMERMNAWFGARQPGLAPTAGYVEDGRRWLRDAAPVLTRMGIAPERLVRQR